MQFALPGLPAQESTAYLCAFAAGNAGGRVAVAFHLHRSGRLAYSLNEEGDVATDGVGKVLERGLRVAEAIGFVLSDIDIHHLEAAPRKVLRESLPLRRGAGTEGEGSAGLEQRRWKLGENLGRFLASF